MSSSYQRLKEKQRIQDVLERSKTKPIVRAFTESASTEPGLIQGINESDYVFRNRCVKAIGFVDYEDYLRSPKWKSIRADVLRQNRDTCYICGGIATEVHHERYTFDNLCGLNRRALKAICDSCHQAIEFNQDGTHRGSLSLVFRAAQERVRQFKIDEPVQTDPIVIRKKCVICQKHSPRAGRDRCRPCANKFKGQSAKQAAAQRFASRLPANRLGAIKFKRGSDKPRCVVCGEGVRNGKEYCRGCSIRLGHQKNKLTAFRADAIAHRENMSHLRSIRQER